MVVGNGNKGADRVIVVGKECDDGARGTFATGGKEEG